MRTFFIKTIIIFFILFILTLGITLTALGADMPPADKITWGMNKVYSSVARAPGSHGAYWMSSLNLVNPLNYNILVQFKDYTNNKSILDLVVLSGEQIRTKDLVSYLGLPDGVYAINILVRAASIDEVLSVGVNVFTYAYQEDGSIKGCSLPEKRYFGKTIYVIPFGFNPNARNMLYIIATNNVKYDIFWYTDYGLAGTATDVNLQGIVRYPVSSDYTYAIIVNKVPYEVSGFSKEPEIYCYSTSTDNISNDTQILTNN